MQQAKDSAVTTQSCPEQRVLQMQAVKYAALTLII